MHQRVKLDPIAYFLIAGLLALELYAMRRRGADVDEIVETSDRTYQAAVFDNGENNGVMHQIFRQNEVDRELLKAILFRCSR